MDRTFEEVEKGGHGPVEVSAAYSSRHSPIMLQDLDSVVGVLMGFAFRQPNTTVATVTLALPLS